MRLSFLLKVFGLTPITFAAAVLEISFSTIKLLSFRYGEIALRGNTYPAPFQYKIVISALLECCRVALCVHDSTVKNSCQQHFCDFS